MFDNSKTHRQIAAKTPPQFLNTASVILTLCPGAYIDPSMQSVMSKKLLVTSILYSMR